MPTKGEYKGTYKVRRDVKGKQSIFVPCTVSGDYAVYVDKDGMMTMIPLGV